VITKKRSEGDAHKPAHLRNITVPIWTSALGVVDMVIPDTTLRMVTNVRVLAGNGTHFSQCKWTNHLKNKNNKTRAYK
jgi:hypothetical protein